MSKNQLQQTLYYSPHICWLPIFPLLLSIPVGPLLFCAKKKYRARLFLPRASDARPRLPAPPALPPTVARLGTHCRPPQPRPQPSSPLAACPEAARRESQRRSPPTLAPLALPPTATRSPRLATKPPLHPARKVPATLWVSRSLAAPCASVRPCRWNLLLLLCQDWTLYAIDLCLDLYKFFLVN